MDLFITVMPVSVATFALLGCDKDNLLSIMTELCCCDVRDVVEAASVVAVVCVIVAVVRVRPAIIVVLAALGL